MARARGRQLIAGLDVGTTKTCCVIAEIAAGGSLEIETHGTMVSDRIPPDQSCGSGASRRDPGYSEARATQGDFQ